MDSPFNFQALSAGDLALLDAVDPRLAEPRRRETVSEQLALNLSWAALGPYGTPLGFAIVSRHFYAYPFVDLLVVSEAHRRGGVGLALMDHCEASHTADRIFTSTSESNAPMRHLLAKAEWRVSGVIENLDPGDPELVFVKFRGDTPQYATGVEAR